MTLQEYLALSSTDQARAQGQLSLAQRQQLAQMKQPSLAQQAAGTAVNTAVNKGVNAGIDGALGGAAGGGAAAGAVGTGFLPALGVGAGAYTGYQQAQGIRNIAKGKDPSLMQSAALFPITGGLDRVASPVARAFGFGGSRTKGEETLRAQLADRGINVPNAGVKEWELNSKFKDSRQESDLTGKDILNAAEFYQELPDYQKYNDAKKEAIASYTLANNLFRERRGKGEVTSEDQGLQDFIKNYQDAPAPVAPTQSRPTQQRAPVKKKPKPQEDPGFALQLPTFNVPSYGDTDAAVSPEEEARRKSYFDLISGKAKG